MVFITARSQGRMLEVNTSIHFIANCEMKSINEETYFSAILIKITSSISSNHLWMVMNSKLLQLKFCSFNQRHTRKGFKNANGGCQNKVLVFSFISNTNIVIEEYMQNKEIFECLYLK